MHLVRQAADVTLAMTATAKRVFVIKPTGSGRLYYVEGRSNAGGGSPGFNLTAVNALASGDSQSIAVPPGESRGFFTFGDAMEIRAVPYSGQSGSILVRVWGAEGMSADRRPSPWSRIGSATTSGAQFSSAIVGSVPPYATKIAGFFQDATGTTPWLKVFGRRTTEAGGAVDAYLGSVQICGLGGATASGGNITNTAVLGQVPDQARAVWCRAVFTTLGAGQGSTGVTFHGFDATNRYDLVSLAPGVAAANAGGVEQLVNIPQNAFTRIDASTLGVVSGSALSVTVQADIEDMQSIGTSNSFEFDIPAGFYDSLVVTSQGEGSHSLRCEAWAA